MTDWRIRLRDAGRALRDDVEPETSQRMRRCPKWAAGEGSAGASGPAMGE